MAKGASIQTLYELCRKTFKPYAGVSASSQSIRKLCSLMDKISPADVGLEEDALEDDRGHGFFESNLFKSSTRTARWAQPITYLHIYECDSFTIGIFCLPTSSVISLHDHPGMTVLSKVLYGSVHVKAYDWVEPPFITNSGPPSQISVRLAKFQADTVLTAPCPTRVLYPKSGGNLHCFTAVTSVAVLDVLAPPYSEFAGRPCTYYHDYPFPSSCQGRCGLCYDVQLCTDLWGSCIAAQRLQHQTYLVHLHCAKHPLLFLICIKLESDPALKLLRRNLEEMREERTMHGLRL